MKKDSRVYLLHIRDALDCIERYAAGGRKAFLADEKTQDAIIYKLAIIGEAVKRLPKPLCDEYPSIPWRSIAGMRNVVIHEYDSTDIPRIWTVVERDVPRLRAAIVQMLDAMDNAGKQQRRAA